MANTQQNAGAQPVLVATFTLQDTVCALEAAGIQEVIRLGPLTPVHRARPDIAGIINLRGRIVTVLDLRLRLGIHAMALNGDSRIVIMEFQNEFVGLLVDQVNDVVEVDAAEWELPPANVSGSLAKCFKAVCRSDGRVISLLDAAQILRGETVERN